MLPVTYEELIKKRGVKPLIPEAGLFSLFEVAAAIRPHLTLDKKWEEAAHPSDYVAKALHERYNSGHRSLQLTKAFATGKPIDEIIIQHVPAVAERYKMMQQNIEEKLWVPADPVVEVRVEEPMIISFPVRKVA